ncbi:hybrid sensor histidine kinase/response regulator transcription factor [Leeuwenhoekiella nanhaiensis]|uniref:histidine kinase n=1 Tax=Leeuwenhoekiella nanhaiensis TaxID=1655491 RepID=A0A2G1VW29_9FLAO|nr:two-component regulator propeller domain-containing protein [Leeuwenhoekiella nanhaiensis]PHQ30987.1 hypothetical protein CJ305_01820 [Leeuwenhoekiella nanhaiensis]
MKIRGTYSSIAVHIICLSVALSCFSQSRPIFENIDQSSGLSNTRVTSIVHENGGFVWMGTKNGLNRYDGKDIKIYNKQNSALSANDIADLYLDQDGNLWIATLGGGLNRYDALQNSFEVFRHNPNVENSIPSNQVNAILEDKKGNLWLATENGLALFDKENKAFQRFNLGPGKKGPGSLSSLFLANDNILWIGSFGNGLFRMDIATGKVERFVSKQPYFSNFIHDLLQLPDGNLLIGTSGGGLLHFDPQTGLYSNFLAYLGYDQEIAIVRKLILDATGSLWVGTDGNGVLRVMHLDQPNQHVFQYTYNANQESSLAGNAIYEIYQDHDHIVWVGTAWNGVSVLIPDRDFTYLYGDILGNNPSPVLSVFKDGETLFLGLDGQGLTVYDQNIDEVTYYKKETGTSLGGNYIQYLMKAQNGIYWMGTFANGLLKFDPRTGNSKQYKHRPGDSLSLSYNDVRYIIEDESGNLWIATWGGGLNYFDPQKETFLSYRADPSALGDTLFKGISSDNVIAMVKDGPVLWLTTFGGGLNRFDIQKGTFEHFVYGEIPKSIASNNLYTIFKDSRNNLWIGTSGEGVNRMNLETQIIERFEDKNYLRYATVTGIVEDEEGAIWISTKQGLFKYEYDSNVFFSFPDQYGEFHINAVFKSDSGRLYFGGINGLLTFEPSQMKLDTTQPRVTFTNFKLFNKEISVSDRDILDKSINHVREVRLEHDMDVITFEFAALNFPFSDNTEYAIKMEGFDEQWREIGKDRTATYTNLSPGSYEFRVKAREEGSSWGEAFTSVKVTILKPFWLTWWAFVIYSLLVLGLFYIFRKYIVAWEQMKSNLRLERLTHEKDTELYNLKQRFFTNISHEIRTPVTLILSAINRLGERKELMDEAISPAVASAKKHGNHLLHLVNELLDFRNLEDQSKKLKLAHTDFIDFGKEICLSFTESALKNDITFHFEAKPSQLMLWFDKNQMEKVFYNLLSNAFKFTPGGGHIKLSVEDAHNEVFLKVQDSGIGISKGQIGKIFNRFYQSPNSAEIQENGFGLGLSITQEIVELHGGKITVESIKGGGTTFIVSLLKGRDHFDTNAIEDDLADSENVEHYLYEGMQLEDTVSVQPEWDELRDLTLLVVEDNLEIRAYLKALLSAQCDLLEAENGEEAFELAISKQPDLIISDIMMPVMDGITLTRKLKENVDTSHIPVILLTARASFIHKMQGYGTGADDYVTKPFNEALLRARIKSLILNRQRLQEHFGGEALLTLNELPVNTVDQKFLEELIKIIQGNIDSENLSADYLSREMGMSHSVIYKKVKALTGMTLVEFVRDYKLKIAKVLIFEQGFSVSEACYKVGYSDRKYFSKLFKKKFGKNPSEFSRK